MSDLEKIGAWHRRMNLELAGKGDAWAVSAMWNCPHGHFATVIENMLAAQQQPAPSGVAAGGGEWRPIATAPIDQRILLWNNDTQEIAIGHKSSDAPNDECVVVNCTAAYADAWHPMPAEPDGEDEEPDAAPSASPAKVGDRQPSIIRNYDDIHALPALWRGREDSCEEETEFDKGFQQASDECAENLENALAQQPAKVAEGVEAHWKVGRFRASANSKQVVLHLSVGAGIERDEQHHSFIEWVYAHPTPPTQGAGVDEDVRALLDAMDDGSDARPAYARLRHRFPPIAGQQQGAGVDAWNSRETLPLDGTKVRILWSNGKEDVGYFERLDNKSEWLQALTREENPEIYANGGEWSTDFGEGDNADFHPVGWLPIDPTPSAESKHDER